MPARAIRGSVTTTAVAATLLLVTLAPVAGAATNDRPGFCNPWFPFPQGARWDYEETSGGGRARAVRSVSVTQVEKTAQGERAVLRQTVREATRRSQARAAGLTEADCEGGAITLTTRGAAEGQAGSSERRGRVTAEVPGLPAPAKLIPGTSWESASRIEADEGGQSIVIKGTRLSRVIGEGPVEVPAGRFQNAIELRIQQTLRRDGHPPARQTIREWFVRGVGMVKREIRVDGGMPDTATVESLRHFSLGGKR